VAAMLPPFFIRPCPARRRPVLFAPESLASVPAPLCTFAPCPAGKGMETYQDKRAGAKKADGPINPEDLFAAYFGKKK